MFHLKLQIIFTLHKHICKYHDSHYKNVFKHFSGFLVLNVFFFLASVNRSEYDDQVLAILWFINSDFPF